MGTEEQIKEYCEKMLVEKSIHKETEALKAELKKKMIDEDTKIMTSGKYQVKLEIRSNDGFDANKLLGVLKAEWEKSGKSGYCPWVKTVEVVDEDALESALYKGDFDKDALAKINGCRTHSETKALTFKINKEAE